MCQIIWHPNVIWRVYPKRQTAWHASCFLSNPGGSTQNIMHVWIQRAQTYTFLTAKSCQRVSYIASQHLLSAWTSANTTWLHTLPMDRSGLSCVLAFWGMEHLWVLTLDPELEFWAAALRHCFSFHLRKSAGSHCQKKIALWPNTWAGIVWWSPH